ncbi:putative peptidase family M49 [Blattamonas nauphoetae]|uniref:Peptidase family M49 n=1 Tax=Blattamonas nauphoetae TaxID=2049346 RepID=A0ABQ9X3U3_9EUKA|nr:putative peptidase family M49 [Blattamonas nauphoetae]
MSEITYVPYVLHGSTPAKAAFVKVELDLSDFNEKELIVLSNLGDAVDLMNSMYQDVSDRNTRTFIDICKRLSEHPDATNEEKEILANFYVILLLHNKPFSDMPTVNQQLTLDRTRCETLLDSLKISQDQKNMALKYFYEPIEPSPKATYYPEELTDEEFNSLPEAAKAINTMILKGENGYKIVPFETYYRGTCQKVIEKVRAARAACDDIKFCLYLDAVVSKFHSGTLESHRVAETLWLQNTYKIDLILSTANEVYMDEWKSIKGTPTGALLIRNNSLANFAKTLKEHAGEIEKNGPSPHFRQELPESLELHLRPVDVVNWSSDYTNAPMTTIAQSLPNDEWISKNFGAVNLIYVNTGKAVNSVSGSRVLTEFVKKAEVDALLKASEEGKENFLFMGDQTHSMMHEVGHTTGQASAEAKAKFPGKQGNEVLGEEYSTFEECRAELFGMYGIEYLKEKEKLDGRIANGAHYGMLVSMITSLKFAPQQAHQKARNMMYHYFLEKGAVTKGEEDGKVKIGLEKERLSGVVNEMLGMIQGIVSNLEVEKAKAFREKYCFEDELMPVVRERTKTFPLGRGLIFPRIEEKSTCGDTNAVDIANTRFVLSYPASFSKMKRFEIPLIEPFGISS